MSSISTMTTFGAPSGALTSQRGGAVALRASSSVNFCGAGSWIGRTVRSSVPSAVAVSASFFAQETATSSDARCQSDIRDRGISHDSTPGEALNEYRLVLLQ